MAIYQETLTDNNTGSGMYIVKQNTPNYADDTRYSYWASPVAGEQIQDVFPYTNTNDFYMYNNGWSAMQPTGIMQPGWGYTATTDIGSSGSKVRAFSSTDLHNGSYTVSGIGSNTLDFVLLGNPYPSALNLDLLVTDNANMVGTFWFWNHETEGQYDSTQDYASFVAGVGGTAANSGGIIPTQYVDKAQGFMTQMSAAGDISFNNTQRSANDAAGFFKTDPKTERELLWLGLINNDINHSNQILVGFVPDATDGFDANKDGYKFKGSGVLAFYSIVQDQDLSIQALEYPQPQEQKYIPLGVDAYVAGSYTIKIDTSANISEDYEVILEDKIAQTYTNLKLDAYTFDLDSAGNYRDRFALNISNHADTTSTTTGIATNNVLKPELVISQGNGILNLAVKQTVSNMKRVQLLDLKGSLVYSNDQVNAKYSSIPVSELSRGVYIVNITLEDNTTFKEKIVIAAH